MKRIALAFLITAFASGGALLQSVLLDQSHEQGWQAPRRSCKVELRQKVL